MAEQGAETELQMEYSRLHALRELFLDSLNRIRELQGGEEATLEMVQAAARGWPGFPQGPH
jgi:hypothetical protein